MEYKLLDSKWICVSHSPSSKQVVACQEGRGTRRCCNHLSKTWSRSTLAPKTTGHHSFPSPSPSPSPSRPGICVQASYSTEKTSNPSFDWVGQDNHLVRNNSTWIIGTNGVISRLSLAQCCVLDSFEDNYDGIVVNSDRLPYNPYTFASMLQSSLSHWKSMGKKGIWLKLPIERSELVPIAVKEGFQYHHAEQEYVMLTYWIPEGPSMLPDNATHQVGVGGFVINDKNEVLVVQEGHCPEACAGLWKLPTGFILESEEIFTGVVREVKEETGIETEFVEVIAFRHALRVAFEKSDLFFICMLRPLSTQIKVDDLEIKDAKPNKGPVFFIYRGVCSVSKWLNLIRGNL